MRRTRWELGVVVLLTAALLEASPSEAPYVLPPQPVGKDVAFVPTAPPLVDTMLDLAGVTPRDLVIDLGSGDGRTVIAAALRGATARGIEYDALLVERARRNAATAGVSERATFVQADLFKTDFSRATVVTMFLLPQINARLQPRILDLRPGTRVVSNTFGIGKWEPDAKVEVGTPCTKWCSALAWIVPAKVQGVWHLDGDDLELDQTFQTISGWLGPAPIDDGRLRGNVISFTAAGSFYIGRVDGDAMHGTLVGARSGSWAATRNLL